MRWAQRQPACGVQQKYGTDNGRASANGTIRSGTPGRRQPPPMCRMTQESSGDQPPDRTDEDRPHTIEAIS